MHTVLPDIHLYQIAYSEATRAAVEPGYAVLDNLANPRPDWYEYWPIRRFLLEQPLDENAFYGFFSPKFGHKTMLSHAQVRDFVASVAERADVVLFSPQPDMGAFFLNVFEQGETFDPGLMDTCIRLLEALGRPVPLHDLVMDTRHVVFSNYFVARPAFWREWLALTEGLFEICEGADSPLRQALCAGTTYPGAAQRKVFVQERMASLLLATQPQWRSVPHDPFDFGWSMSKLRQHPTEAYISDALKYAWREQRFPEYLRAYAEVRERLRAAPPQPETPPVAAASAPTPPAAPAAHRELSMNMKQTPAHSVVNQELLSLIPDNARRVVEIGCMLGAMAQAFRATHPEAEYVGVDIDPEYAQAAAQHCTRSLAGDVERLDPAVFDSLFPSDCWIFGDCLEHLRDPWMLLKRIRAAIDPQGCLLVCIPNAQHWSVQWRLASGNFRYEDSGLLDRTHIRWFTRITMLEMFAGAGWQVAEGMTRNLPHSPLQDNVLTAIRAMAQAGGFDPDMAAQDAIPFQYVFKLTPA